MNDRHRWTPANLLGGWSRQTLQATALTLAASIALLVWQGLSFDSTRIPDYPAWHGLIEILSVGTSMLVGLIAWFSTERTPLLRPLGVAFIGVAVLDAQHLLVYQGMPDWMGTSDTNRAIVFWLGGRTLIVLGFLALLGPASLRRAAVAALLATVAAVTWIGHAMPSWVPSLFVPGLGLSDEKIVLEWVLVTAYLLLAIQVQRARLEVRNDLLAAGLLVLASAELYFTLYRESSALANLLGHVFKVIGEAFLLRAMVVAYVVAPLRALKAAGDAQRDIADRFASLVNGAPEGILVAHRDGRILSSNARAEALFGAAPGELLTLQIDDLLPPAQRAAHGPLRDGFHARPRVRVMAPTQALHAARRDGSEFPVDISLAPVDWQGEPCVVAFIRDVTERTDHLARLDWLASHDELTGLPNRRSLLRQLDARLHAAEEGVCALIGMDNLGRINNFLGHEVGDELLRHVAQVLGDTCTAGDLVGRLDGDRFVVLLPDDVQAAGRLRALHQRLCGEVHLGSGAVVERSATVGFCRYPQDGHSAPLLLQRAEIALMLAKRRARRAMIAFEMDQEVYGRRWVELAARMPMALRDGEFHLVYQPRVALADGRLRGMEVLLRWGNGGRAIGPGEFIPVAEESGFVLALGRWVIEQTIAQAAAWQREGLDYGRLSINLSTRQLADSSLPGFLSETLDRHLVLPARIELEITESAAMENLDWARARLDALAAIGCALALDDFGTGYSSLAYLQNLPFSVIKIDIAFVRGIGSEDGEALLRAMFGLSKGLGRQTVAEGVETPTQSAWLAMQGCDEGQGYLFARPLAPEAATAALREARRQPGRVVVVPPPRDADSAQAR